LDRTARKKKESHKDVGKNVDKEEKTFFFFFKKREKRNHPKVIEDLPPGGARTLDVGLPLIKFPTFCPSERT
jgi:hypothetical protein